jgi:hypothetical protein
MLEAMLDPANGYATAVAVAALADGPAVGRVSHKSVLALLRDIPEVERLSGGVVASWHSSLGSLHARRWHRVTYDKPLLITPLDDDSERPAQQAFLVRGRDLSLAGISFCHPHPLASRKVVVQFCGDLPDRIAGIVTILRWCRFRRDGSYQSGGQFVRGMDLGARPLSSDADCSNEPSAVLI